MYVFKLNIVMCVILPQDASGGRVPLGDADELSELFRPLSRIKGRIRIEKKGRQAWGVKGRKG